MTYLSIGTNFINLNLFLDVINGKDGKPNGGIWATTYDTNFPTFSYWIEYLCRNPYLIFSKNYPNPFEIPAILFKLQPTSKIFNLDSKEQLNFLKKYYPDKYGWIDFQTLALHYDGIFFNLDKLKQEAEEKDKIILQALAINCLNIFKPNCIQAYQKAMVKFTPYDFEYEKPTEYEIITCSKEQLIPSINMECFTLIESIVEYIHQHNFPINNDTFKILKERFKQQIEMIYPSVSNGECPEEVQNLLIRKALHKSI